MALRCCRRCREDKPEEQFALRSYKRPGQRSTMCKACFAVYRKEPHGKRLRALPAPPGMKTCPACRTAKALEAFPPSKQERDGRHSYCRVCLSAKYQGRYVEQDAVYRARHAVEMKERGLRWPSTIGPAALAGRRHREGKRRAAKLASPAVKLDLLALYARDGGRCWICRRDTPFAVAEFDHVVPISRGGPHTPENLRVSCGPCNRRKHDKLPTPELIANVARATLAQGGAF